MADNLIIERAIDELKTKRFGTTKQLLEIHDVVYVDDKPQVLRVDTEYDDKTAIVYFPIKGERFYLAVWLDTKPEICVRGVETENYNAVYLKVTSDDLSFQELSSLTKLKPTSGWSKGDSRKSGKSFYNFSALHFEPNPEPDEFEDKLRKLLDFLEKDKSGIAAQEIERLYQYEFDKEKQYGSPGLDFNEVNVQGISNYLNQGFNGSETVYYQNGRPVKSRLTTSYYPDSPTSQITYHFHKETFVKRVLNKLLGRQSRYEETKTINLKDIFGGLNGR